MSDVKRYMLDAHIDGINQFREFIRAEDYDRLEAENKELKEKLEVARTDELNAAVYAETESLKHQLWDSQRELETLRSRVAVVPKRNEYQNRVPWEFVDGWNACLDEVQRLNGKTVSEGLLRKWLELMEHGDFREGHCMCGSAVNAHGIGDGHAPVDAGEYYAGQVMEELRALLDEV